MRKSLFLLMMFCCSACLGQGLAFGSGSIGLQYYRYADALIDMYGSPASVFVCPMELDGKDNVTTVGSYCGNGTLWRDNTHISPETDAALFNQRGMQYRNNLSQDAMLVFYDSPPITSDVFTIGWWMRVDEISTITTTINDGFNVHLRNSNGVDYLRMGLVYSFPDPLATDTLNLRMGVRYAYSDLHLFDGYDTATFTVNVGDWHHYAVRRYALGPYRFMAFFLDGAVLATIEGGYSTGGTVSFAKYLWLGYFGFSTPIENYTTVKISVDEFFYTTPNFVTMPTGKMTSTQYGIVSLGGNE